MTNKINTEEKHYKSRYLIGCIENYLKKIIKPIETDLEHIVKSNNIANTGMVLYPNPVDDQLWIKSTTHWSRYKIYDLNGQLKMQGNLDKQTPTILLSNLSTGIYFISCVDQLGHQQVNQFIKK